MSEHPQLELAIVEMQSKGKILRSLSRIKLTRIYLVHLTTLTDHKRKK